MLHDTFLADDVPRGSDDDVDACGRGRKYRFFFLLYSILSPELYYFVQKQQQKPSKADYKYRLSKRNINGLLFRSIQRKPI